MRRIETHDDLQEAILAFLDWRGDGIAFTEIGRFVPELNGNTDLLVEGYPRLVYWPNLSTGGVAAFRALLQAGSIALLPASPLLYVLDGYTSRLPIANAQRAYRSARWYPVSIAMGEELRAARASRRPRTRREQWL